MAALCLALTACGQKRPTSGGAAVSTASSSTLSAHPQAVNPTAGVVAAQASADPTAPVGDPNAHAPSLADVRKELKILNLCGGATTSAFAQPVVKGSGPGFMPDPGTQQTQGQLPILTARLNALAKSLGVVIYGISGYRTPAHSVAVGGYADDPHTKGLAEDIGVNSLLRSSAAQISEAELARFGLYRPFDPSGDPNNSEVNHIQLIPSGGPLSLAQATTRFTTDPRCRNY
jgi:Peptidase M15